MLKEHIVLRINILLESLKFYDEQKNNFLTDWVSGYCNSYLKCTKSEIEFLQTLLSYYGN